MTNVLELADLFFKAIEQGDVETMRSIYSPDAVIWHNFDPLTPKEKGDETVSENLKKLEMLPQRIRGAKFEVYQREATETGFVQQYVLTGRMVNDEPFLLPACIVCRVKDGLIVRVDEYYDPAIVRRLRKVVEEYTKKK